MIHEKLYKFQSEVGRIKKDKKNPHFKSNYADLNSVYSAIKPLFDDLGLMFSHTNTAEDGRDQIHTIIFDTEDNSTILSSSMLPVDNNPQKVYAAQTYFKRMHLISMLALETVDNDGDVGSNSIKESKRPTEEMVLEIESLMNGDEAFKIQWLNFLNVKSFDKASYAAVEKAIKQLK